VEGGARGRFRLSFLGGRAHVGARGGDLAVRTGSTGRQGGHEEVLLCNSRWVSAALRIGWWVRSWRCGCEGGVVVKRRDLMEPVNLGY